MRKTPQLLSDDAPEIRLQAALRLKLCGCPIAARTLAIRLKEESHPEAKRIHLYAIGFMDKRTATKWLSSIVATSDDEIVLYYGLHLLRIHNLRAPWAAIPLLSETRPAVLFAAVQYLQTLELKSAGLRTAIERLRDLVRSSETDWASSRRGNYYKGRSHIMSLLN